MQPVVKNLPLKSELHDECSGIAETEKRAVKLPDRRPPPPSLLMMTVALISSFFGILFVIGGFILVMIGIFKH